MFVCVVVFVVHTFNALPTNDLIKIIDAMHSLRTCFYEFMSVVCNYNITTHIRVIHTTTKNIFVSIIFVFFFLLLIFNAHNLTAIKQVCKCIWAIIHIIWKKKREIRIMNFIRLIYWFNGSLRHWLNVARTPKNKILT